jgi:hypothetical protein
MIACYQHLLSGAYPYEKSRIPKSPNAMLLTNGKAHTLLDRDALNNSTVMLTLSTHSRFFAKHLNDYVEILAYCQ